MKANELRVGNLFRWKSTNEVDVVHDIVTYGRKPTINNVNIQDVEPIPLTEEWLLRFWFRKADEGCFWIDLQTHYFELIYSNLHWYPIISQLPEMSSEEEQKVGLNAIDHVHQLQNLYFALTGQELTIKEAAR